MDNYENDEGFDSSYEPALPEHDLVRQARAEGYELYTIGTGDLLVYDQETKKRIMSVAPTGVLDLEEALSAQKTVDGSEGSFRIDEDECELDTPDGHLEGSTKLIQALREVSAL